MSRPLLDRSQFGPPEHWDDEIRAYRSSERYVPTALEQLLYELAGHRCTICKAPWLEIHHITELANGGRTEYENLIVLCPNCHTRVHADGVPSTNELRNYKTKQEIAYELPVLSRLTSDEKHFLNELLPKSPQERMAHSKRFYREVEALSADLAIEAYRQTIGHFELLSAEVVRLELENIVAADTGVTYHVSLRIHLTGKGQKWLRYLESTARVPQ